MIYEPLFENGRYVDNLELFEKNKPGIEHVCKCRDNQDSFSSRSVFTQHIKLKCHQRWLTSLSSETISPIPSHSLQSHSLPPHSLPSHSLPSHSLPSYSLPPHSLKDEQDDEYERTLEQDRQKAEDKLNEILKESEAEYEKEQERRAIEEELERKRRSIVDKTGYTFRFIFPTGKKVSYTIHKTRPVSYMRDIVDVYMADNHHIYSYELFIFPNRILDTIHTIEEAGIENRSSIYVRSLEN